MAEPKNNETKGKKNKSLGAFLLFLTILVAILITVGKQSLGKPDQYNQDQFEWHVYRGDIDTLTVSGNNLIEGKLKSGKDYRVAIASVDKDSAQINRYRALKAVPGYEKITADALRTAVERGWYQPQQARILHASQELNASEAAAAGDKEPAPRREFEVIEELYVSVLATPPAAPAGAAPSEETPAKLGVPMPKSGSSALDLRVDGPADSTGLVAMLQGKGATFERINFDITPNKGTKYEEAGGLLQTMLFYYAPWVLIFVVFLLFMRQMRAQGGTGGVMSFGRSRAQLYTKENHTNVTFDDVAGAQEAKDEVREVVEFQIGRASCRERV